MTQKPIIKVNAEFHFTAADYLAAKKWEAENGYNYNKEEGALLVDWALRDIPKDNMPSYQPGDKE